MCQGCEQNQLFCKQLPLAVVVAAAAVAVAGCSIWLHHSTAEKPRHPPTHFYPFIQAIGKSELSQTQTTENCHKFSACRQTMPVLRNIASSMPRCLYASIVVISHCSLPSCSPEFNSHDFCSWSRLFNRMKRLQLITGNAICKLFRLMQFH